MVTTQIKALPCEYNDGDEMISRTYGGSLVGVYDTREKADAAATADSAYGEIKGNAAYDYYGAGEEGYGDLSALFVSPKDPETLIRLLEVFGPKRVGFDRYDHDMQYYRENARDYLYELHFPADMTLAEWEQIKDLFCLQLDCNIAEVEVQ